MAKWRTIPIYTGNEPALDPPLHWLSGQKLAEGMLTEAVKVLKENNEVHTPARKLFELLHVNNYKPMRVNGFVRRQFGLSVLDFSDPLTQRIIVDGLKHIIESVFGLGSGRTFS